MAQAQIRTPNKVICTVLNDIIIVTLREVEQLDLISNETAVRTGKKSAEITVNPKLELHFETGKEGG